MGWFTDLMLSEDWEKFQRVRLYKKLGEKLEDIDTLSPEKLNKIKKILEEEE